MNAIRHLPSVAVLAAAVSAAALPAARAEEPAAEPRLVTFGPLALVNEGDHDFRQLVRFSVPEAAGELHVRVFDPDAGGRYDEPKGGYDTETRYSLYGADATARLWRDGKGVVQEDIGGQALASASFRADAASDGRWVTLFSAPASAGRAGEDGRREFVLLVEGRGGNDGNVFDVAVSTAADENRAPEGLRVYSFLPTFQVPHGGLLAELGFGVPAGAGSLAVENFDAAGGRLEFGGRFRSAGLVASGKSQWRRDLVALDGGEAGQVASLTATEGSENPNDMTMFVGVPQGAADAVERPVAIELPVRAIAPSRRPEVALAVTPLACGRLRFDAGGSRDPEGGTLSYNWRLGDATADGALVERDFAGAGERSGRLEVFDGSGLIGSGRAQDFTFLVKAPPVADFEAPALVAEGAEVQLDGSGSTSPALPAGNHLPTYRWSLGDGTEVVQKAGEPGFGKLAHRYLKAGSYTIRLTVEDSAADPCNSATASREITVNAQPVANAGGPRSVVAGDIASFDAGLSRDPDGSIVSYVWDFGDGTRAEGRAVEHTYHRPGTYQARLTVLDDSPFDSGKGIDVVAVTVVEPQNGRPAAQAGPDRTVAVGEVIRFDGTQSTDPDGAILFYSWDLGDGAGSDSPVVEHSYWQPGTYSVTLTVTGNAEAESDTAIDSALITVTPPKNRAPVATFPKDFSTTTFRPLLLDASRANDRDGSIVSYDWDFGDGSQGTGPVVSHLYSAPGTYAGRLTLSDDGYPEPATTAFDFTVLVANRPNQVPVAAAGADIAASVGEQVALDAGQTRDPDGSILSYAWDLGDGNLTSGIVNRHVYQFPGRYEVRLTVGDDGPADRLSAQDTLTVTVSAVPNQPPAAAIAAKLAVATGEIVRFDGAGSADPDGNILAYRWDFGDGGASSDASPPHAFHDAGKYRVRLTVTDDGTPALTGEREVEVTVTDPSSGSAQ